jgi:1-acyl-sn-glycerol-3-phosphate acyltransferase
MHRRLALFRTLLPIVRDILLRRPRSLRADAPVLISAAGLAIRLVNPEHIPPEGSFLLVTNHYSRPGLGVWWAGLGLSAAISRDMHWIITGAWTGSPFTPLSRWVLARTAKIYGLTAMPPMPPDARDAAERAAAVRRVIQHARRPFHPVVALAPEGRDFPGHQLGLPPPGAGRFMLHLSQILSTIIPAGVYEENDKLVLHFGPPFSLDLPPGLYPAQQDALMSRMVMEKIACLVPFGQVMSEG